MGEAATEYDCVLMTETPFFSYQPENLHCYTCDSLDFSLIDYHGEHTYVNHMIEWIVLPEPVVFYAYHTVAENLYCSP